MKHAEGFHDREGILYADDLNLADLAWEYGTPLYVYSASRIRQKIGMLSDAFASALPPGRRPLIAFATKANTNKAVLNLMASSGLGADVVSGGEMLRAMAAGIPAEKIVFSGVGKTDEELRYAIDHDILQINVESAAELERIMAMKPTRPVRLGFRLNPDVDAGTHAKISTGHSESKFGMPAEEIADLYALAGSIPNLKPVGLSLHIGSQLTSLDPFAAAFENLARLGQKLKCETLDFGGGLGISYNNEKLVDLNVYAGLVRDILAPLNAALITEPGRFLVGDGGILLSRIIDVKTTTGDPILILDAGMNDLMRPALYDAVHRILPVSGRGNEYKMTFDIAGPVCESSDIFASAQSLPELKRGDLVALMDTGAYGASMASTYNSRPLPAEIMVDGSRHGLVRKRQTLQDIIRDETVPDWLNA